MYIIQEIQTNGNQSALVPAAAFADRNQAESAYHTALAAAAVSAVQVHAVLMYDEHGSTIKRDYYEHLGDQEAEV